MFLKQKINPKNKCGVVLVEFLVVVAVVGLLVSLIMVTLQNIQKESRDTKRKDDLQQVKTALSLYLSSTGNGQYPVQDEFNCLFEALDILVSNNILVDLPDDPLDVRTNVATGCYNYQSDGDDYKLRTNLENDSTTMQKDEGVSEVWYEIFTAGAQTWE